MAQKYTEKKKISNRKWDSENLDRMSIALPKGKKQAIEAHIKAHPEKQDKSVNRFINRAIDETMQRDDQDQGNEVNP